MVNLFTLFIARRHGKRFTLESRIRLETMLKFPNVGLLVQESDAKRII